MVAFIPLGEVSLESLVNHSLNWIWGHVVLVGFGRSGIRSSSGRRCHKKAIREITTV
ncbi:hypothetical protein Tco_1518507, partial [Tanacetum coccineum]